MEVLDRTYYLNEQQYAELQVAWAVLSRTKQITAADMVLYNVMRGKESRHGFVEKRTNIQGNNPWFAHYMATLNARLLTRSGDRFKERYGMDVPAGLIEKLKDD